MIHGIAQTAAVSDGRLVPGPARHFFTRCLLLLLLTPAQPGMSALPRAEAVSNGGTWTSAPGLEVRLTEADEPLRIEVKGDGGANSGMRWRYRLEGVDDRWRDPDGYARFMVRFLDAHGRLIAEESYPLKGESSGWTGSLPASTFVRQRMDLKVPPEAAEACLFVVTTPAGGGPCMGKVAIHDVRAIVESGNAPVVVHRLDPDEENANWWYDGSRPKFAQLLHDAAVSPHALLMVKDDVPLDYALWTTKRGIIPVQGGDRLTVDWLAAYSVGRGGDATLEYARLEPGSYRLRLAEAHVDGTLTGQETALSIIVRPVWWRRPSSWAVAALLLIAGTAWFSRFLVRRRMAVQMRFLEHQRLLEAERTRISRDIHDTLGANLTQIAMVGQLAQLGDAGPLGLEDIVAIAEQSVRSLNEIVWAIKPENDNPESLLSFLCQFAEDYLQDAGLRFRLDAPDELPKIKLGSAQRHHLFLAVREALHNVVKHARAREVQLSTSALDSGLRLAIKDDGCGFDLKTGKELATIISGNGLANMQSRMAEIGGTFFVESTPGFGTLIGLFVPSSNGPDHE